MATSSGALRPPLKLVILISGRGSNMRALVSACQEKRIHAEVALVICDNPEGEINPGMASAAALGVETARIPWRGAKERATFEEQLHFEIERAQADLIVLAGFMRLLSASFVHRYPGRILNIHPSLLPRHKGLHPHRRVLEAGEAEHGASVHFLTPEVDSGPVVLQSRIKVRREDTEETLAARVLKTEHQIYAQAIGWIADGKLQWCKNAQGEGPVLNGEPLTAPIVQDFP